ncbi:MAG TPA: response regulator, partial [Gammaproteobacteria bacterium]|nr:response regulator [Gammaproteobacteria bacterium]
MAQQQIRTALIVDDSRLARIALSKLLMNRGIEVAMASCGEDGLEHLRSHQPDVVFMDYMMPDMDGFEASRRVLADPDCHKPAIVMYTSQDTEEDRLKAREIGIAGFLGKPTTLTALDEVLNAVAAEQQRRAAPASRPAPAVEPASPRPVARVQEPKAPTSAPDAARAAVHDAVREASEQLALRYFEQLRQELADGLARVQTDAEDAAARRAATVVEAALSRLAPSPEPVDVAALEAQIRQAATDSAQQVAGGVAREAGAAAARALAPQLAAEARQAAVEAVELTDLPGRLQAMVEQDALPIVRQELLTATFQEVETAVQS